MKTCCCVKKTLAVTPPSQLSLGWHEAFGPAFASDLGPNGAELLLRSQKASGMGPEVWFVQPAAGSCTMMFLNIFEPSKDSSDFFWVDADSFKPKYFHTPCWLGYDGLQVPERPLHEGEVQGVRVHGWEAQTGISWLVDHVSFNHSGDARGNGKFRVSWFIIHLNCFFG